MKTQAFARAHTRGTAGIPIVIFGRRGMRTRADVFALPLSYKVSITRDDDLLVYGPPLPAGPRARDVNGVTAEDKTTGPSGLVSRNRIAVCAPFNARFEQFRIGGSGCIIKRQRVVIFFFRSVPRMLRTFHRRTFLVLCYQNSITIALGSFIT